MTSTDTMDSLEIGKILALLPHRYPFLLVDRIVDIDGDESATGIKNVTFNEPHFQGHFPGTPIMPGVLIIEAMAQTCGAIVARKQIRSEPKPIYFMTIDQAKFRKTVVPGDTLHIRVKKYKHRQRMYKFSCTAHVGDDKVAEAMIAAMMGVDA